MSLYFCNAVPGSIPEKVKPKIAEDITEIHCDVTGAPPTFVHVFFFEDAPQLPINGKTIFLFGNIHAGRSEQQKQDLVDRMKASIHLHAGVPIGEVVVDTAEVPANWVMQGGELPPEQGQGAACLDAHDLTPKLKLV